MLSTGLHLASESSKAMGSWGIFVLRRWRVGLLALCVIASAFSARGTERSAATIQAQNDVSRELGGAAGPLTVGDNVFRNELVRTGANSTAKLVFLDSTNLAIGPTSRVTLDVFVYSGQASAQKMTVNLAKGLFALPLARSTREPT